MDACSSGCKNALKRSASPSFQDRNDHTRKRLKESDPSSDNSQPHKCPFAEELVQELQCPCCSALAHRPVVVIPCQHMFCGSCCLLWIKNGGTSCPSCRSLSSTAIPSRPLELVIQSLIRSFPEHARAPNELKQADQVYKQGVIRIPSPREVSPEPAFNPESEFARPCPTCLPSNPYGWTCPVPIPDPTVVGIEGAWLLEDGPPPGHGNCGNCENLMALASPMSSRCDFCAVPFCGIGVRGRCQAMEVSTQNPRDLVSLEDLLTCAEMYDQCFFSNNVEADIMLEYLGMHNIKPRTIYQQIVHHVQEQPNSFEPLIEDEVFPDAPMGDDDGHIPRRKICRDCARVLFMWGLRDWWVRERKNGRLGELHAMRPNCPNGSHCEQQRETEHATIFNHIIPPHVEPPPEPPSTDTTDASKKIMPLPPNISGSFPMPNFTIPIP